MPPAAGVAELSTGGGGSGGPPPAQGGAVAKAAAGDTDAAADAAKRIRNLQKKLRQVSWVPTGVRVTRFMRDGMDAASVHRQNPKLS